MIANEIISPIFNTPTKYDILNVVHNSYHLKENINNILKIKPIHYSISFKKLSTKTPYTITAHLIENHQESDIEIKLTFFAGNPKWWNKLFPLNEEATILGKPKIFHKEISFVHPKKIENTTYFLQKEQTIITPRYKKTEQKIPHSTIQKQILEKILEIPEISPAIYSKIKKQSCINSKLNIKSALTEIHSPSSVESLIDAKKFLALFEFISYKNTLKQINHHTATPLNFEKNSIESISKIFKFPLTNGQKNAVTKISQFQQSKEGKLFLLQGDVGCGKTIVAIISTLNAINSGFQTAIIAPTQILATQLYQNFNEILTHFDISCTLLMSKENAKSKKEKLQSIENGKIQVVIGTHAIFSNAVEFKNLGFTIIDEQHKFGVNQRLSLMQKSQNAKCLLMTATPIPRTLSMSMYSGIEYFSIQEKPNNRLPINTTVISAEKSSEIITSIKKKFRNHFKMYWVCPLIDSENSSKSNIKEREQYLLKHFKENEIITIHGKMKEEEINNALIKFKEDASIKILLATTIVEVGIDIPNANIIIIESAENFGLASLHQLRGRVGRNSEQGYCILLLGENVSANAKIRLQAMKDSNDGFYISEVDRKIRGSGNILGEEQSGTMKFKFFDEDIHQNEIQAFESTFLDLTQSEQDDISQIFISNKNLEYSYS